MKSREFMLESEGTEDLNIFFQRWIVELTKELKYFDQYVQYHGYEYARERVLPKLIQTDPVVILLANKSSSIKLLKKYESLKQRFLNKINSGL